LFKEFVPYALWHNQNVQIPLLEKFMAYNFFLYAELLVRVTLSPVCDQIFRQSLHSHELPKFPLSHNKNSTHHLVGINIRLNSVRCIFRFAYSLLYINKTNRHVCVCSNIETELHLFTATLTAHL